MLQQCGEEHNMAWRRQLRLSRNMLEKTKQTVHQRIKNMCKSIWQVLNMQRSVGVKFEKMSQMKIYLQRSLPIDPKTGQMMPDDVDKRLPNPAVVTRISICAAHTCYSQVRQPWSKARPARSCALLLPTVARTVGSVFEMIDSRIYEPFDIFGGKGLASAEPLTQFQVVVYELSHS